MSKISINLDPYTFTGSAILIGFLLVGELTPDEQDSIGNWLELVGMVLQTYSSQVTTLESYQKDDKNKNNEKTDLDTLRKTLKKIEQQLYSWEKQNK